MKILLSLMVGGCIGMSIAMAVKGELQGALIVLAVGLFVTYARITIRD